MWISTTSTGTSTRTSTTRSSTSTHTSTITSTSVSQIRLTGTTCGLAEMVKMPLPISPANPTIQQLPQRCRCV
jgi:hypothetical protein